MENKIFFVFTCVYNGRKYIKNLFTSMLHQTCTNFIHYIYDDGSTESIDDLIDEYRKKASELTNPFIVIYEKNDVNIGLNLATKHCIEKCTLPYFIWIDCDNWIHKDFFKYLNKTIKKHPNSIVYTTTLLNERGLDFRDGLFIYKKSKKSKKSKIQFKYFVYGFYNYSFFAVNYSLYKKINKNVYFEDTRNFFNDEQTILSCILSNHPFAHSNKSLGYFLYRENSEGFTNETHDLKYKFSTYSNYCKKINNLNIDFKIILYLRNSFWKMNELKNIDFNSSMHLFFTRKKIAKDNKLLSFLYLYGNSFTWFLKIIICGLRNKIK